MKTYNISVFVRTKDQLKTVLAYDICDIYSDNLELIQKNPGIYYKPLKGEKKDLPNNILTEDTGLLYEYSNQKNIIIDYNLNVANTKTIKLLQEFGAKRIILSLELSKEELSFFKDLKKIPAEIYLYGIPEVMLLKRHPVFEKGDYLLEDQRKRKYPVKVGEDKMVHIYHHEPMDKTSDLEEYIKMGVRYFRVDFLEENVREIENILKKVGLTKK